MTTKTNRRPHPIVAVARATWRQLRTMRTALILLLLLGAGASLGSLFPQRPINPATVSQWIARNRGWAPIAEKLGLFDVFGSWWFMAIYGLLVVFFAYFYTAIAFNPIDTADNIRKYGGFIPGIRPGQPTATYLSGVLNRITLPGSLFLAAIRAAAVSKRNCCAHARCGAHRRRARAPEQTVPLRAR